MRWVISSCDANLACSTGKSDAARLQAEPVDELDTLLSALLDRAFKGEL